MSPTDLSGVRQFLKIVNKFAKFLLDFRELLLKKNLFHWDTAQQKAFEKIQNLVTHLPVLLHYNPNHETLLII